MTPPYPIYLLRHGQTEWNSQGRLQGRLDSPLTAKGLQQARNMAAALKALLDPALKWRLVCSPQLRAYKTAEIIGEICGLALESDDRLREASMGEWEGLTGAEIEAGWPNPSGQYRFLQAPGGETHAHVSARAGEWLRNLDRPTIAVSHGVTGRIIRSLYLNVDPKELPSMAGVNQDGLYYLEQGNVTFLHCIEHCEPSLA